MKILFSHFGIKDKGGFSRTFNLAKGIAKQGHQVFFITNQEGWSSFPYIKEERDNVQIFSFPDILPKKFLNYGFGFLSIVLKLFFLRTKRFDIVHSDTGHRPSSGIPSYFVQKRGAIYISEWWDNYGKGGQLDEKPFYFKIILGKYEEKSEIKNKLRADGIVVLSKKMKERALKIGISENKISIIHGGSDISNIKTNDKILTRIKYGIPIEQLIFGYIGMSSGDIKNLTPFIRAIQDPLIPENIKFMTFGKFLPSNIKKKYFKRDNLIEYGWVNFFKSCDILSVPDVYILFKEDSLVSNSGWPNKLGDYLATGKPVLIFLYGELFEFYKKYPDGLIPVSYDINSVKNMILNIFNNKYDLIKMGAYNRYVAEKFYSWDCKAIDLLNTYNKIIQLHAENK